MLSINEFCDAPRPAPPSGCDRDCGARPPVPVVDNAPDLIAAMDDSTRHLLRRHANARRSQVIPRYLVAADLLGLSLAYVTATIVFDSHGALGSPHELLVFLVMLPCWVFLASAQGLYSRYAEHPDRATTDDVVGVLFLVTLGVWLLLVASQLSARSDPRVEPLIIFWGSAIALVAVLRWAARELCRRSGAYMQNTVIVGAGDVGQLIGRKLIRHPEYGINVVGFVDRDPKCRRADLPEHLTILGHPDRLPEIVHTLDVERVIVAFSDEPLSTCWTYCASFGASPSKSIWCHDCLSSPTLASAFIQSRESHFLGFPVRAVTGARAAKRAIDIVGSTLGLILLSPMFAFIAVQIKLDDGGPVLFRQTRLSQGMQEFTMLKFRTMKVDTDQSVHQHHVKQTMDSTSPANESGIISSTDRTS